MPISEGRRLAALASSLAALAACSRAPAGQGAGERLPCARGDAALAADCTVERTTTPRGLVLTLRDPDGGFHRLLATRDGRGLVAADGAVPAEVTVVGRDRIDVQIEGNRYRLPATIR